jgi:phosphohistidine phosphatase SixA
MKLIKFFLIIFISLVVSIKANSNEPLIEQLKKGGKLIFIRHAYAPGNGDPKNFNIDECSTQRNLNQKGKKQAKIIGLFFEKNNIPIDKVISSQWCRCKETASIAFGEKYQVISFLNSFYDEKFFKNKDSQIKELKEYVSKWNRKKNLIFITHYVVISEVLDFYPSSGEIVISDKDYNVTGNLNFKF